MRASTTTNAPHSTSTHPMARSGRLRGTRSRSRPSTAAPRPKAMAPIPQLPESNAYTMPPRSSSAANPLSDIVPAPPRLEIRWSHSSALVSSRVSYSIHLAPPPTAESQLARLIRRYPGKGTDVAIVFRKVGLLGVEAPERIAGREVATKGGADRCARPPSMRNYRRRAARHETERPRDDHPGATERVRLATLAVRNATPNPSPSKTCPPRSASQMPRPPGTAGSRAWPGLSRGDGALNPA